MAYNQQEFKEMLTLGRVRGMFNKNKFSQLSACDIWAVRDWLDDLLIEVNQLYRTADFCYKKKGGIGAVEAELKELNHDTEAEGRNEQDVARA
jgi:hypothetical protein